MLSYIHDLDPVLFRFTEDLAIRWYGLAYIAGFIAGYFLLKLLSRRKLYPVPPDKLGDFITMTAIFGVLIGGRLGHFLFYQIPNEGMDAFLADPWAVFRVWEGGMASHGGMIGVLLYTWWYARRHKVSWLAITDGLAIVAPVGLFFGRVANFINGELFGRVTDATSAVAMKFPAEIMEPSFPRDKWFELLARVEQAAGQLSPGNTFYAKSRWMIDLARENGAVQEILGGYLAPRYPSQLYEAAAEGLLLFCVLWWVRLRYPKAPNGTFCMLFCFLYAVARIVTECYREPDSDTWYGITRGQYLSFGLVLGGVLFAIPVVRACKRRRDATAEMKR